MNWSLLKPPLTSIFPLSWAKINMLLVGGGSNFSLGSYSLFNFSLICSLSPFFSDCWLINNTIYCNLHGSPSWWFYRTILYILILMHLSNPISPSNALLNAVLNIIKRKVMQHFIQKLSPIFFLFLKHYDRLFLNMPTINN